MDTDQHDEVSPDPVSVAAYAQLRATVPALINELAVVGRMFAASPRRQVMDG